MQLVVLPGMDGGADLSRECVWHLAKSFPIRVIEYPNEVLSTEQLADYVTDRCVGLDRPVLIAESFSGPIAIEVLRRDPARFAAGVLACTFVLPPRSPGWRPFVHAPLFSRPPPAWAIRRWMVGPRARKRSVEQVQAAIAKVSPAVMASRVRSVLAVDARTTLAQVTTPLLSIRAQRDGLVDSRSTPEAHIELPTLTIDAPHLAFHVRGEECAIAIRNWLTSNR